VKRESAPEEHVKRYFDLVVLNEFGVNQWTCLWDWCSFFSSPLFTLSFRYICM